MSALVQLRRSRPAAPAPDPASPSSATSTSSASPGSVRLAYIETYGCQMNVADSDVMLGLLHDAGYGRTADAARADLILINTCAVREKAEERVFARASMLAAHKSRPGVILGVTGCMAEHLKERVRQRAPHVDLVLGPDGYRRLVGHVEHIRLAREDRPTGGGGWTGHGHGPGTRNTGASVEDTALDRAETYEGLDPARAMSDGVTGQITIQRGCDKFCTFCVVPYTRGRERGTAPGEILRQARALAAAGYKQVQLLGQTVNSYRHEGASFAEVLRAVASVDGIERVRFTSPYPLDFSAGVIAAIAETDKVCKHVHLPLQSAADSVLGRMRRGYTYAQFRALVAALRAAMPAVAITTDLLVGFCDETEDEHLATLEAQDELRFDAAFMFAYSEREGTTAARKLPDSVPEEVKQRRLATVIARQQRITGEILRAQVGRRERVLVEARSKRSELAFLARADSFRPVIVAAAAGVEPGALLDVVIEGATSATLLGRACGTG